MEGATDSMATMGISQENQEISSAVVKEKTSSENSEYDSVDSYSDEDEQPVVKARSRASGLDSHSGSEERIIQEREEGDGQESIPSKKVDDDEDKKNPQYIPKRGTFYEHDDRTADDVENQEPLDPEKADKDGKKKVWQDKKERWTHDRFNDQEQTPKTRTELVAIYGYDIRNEDGPPRARRRRRYGRGPNKYTRNWEDEDAYSKPPPTHPPRSATKPTREKTSNKNTEEFPPLGGGGRNSRSSEPDQEESQTNYQENKSDTIQNRKSYERQEQKRQPEQHQQQSQSKPSTYNNRQFRENNRDTQSDQNQNRSNQPAKVGTGRIVKPKKEVKDSDYTGFTTKTRQQRIVRVENPNILPSHNTKKESDFIQTQNFTNKNNISNQAADLEKEISQLNIQDGVYRGGSKHSGGSNSSSRQGSVPPRLQNSEQKGSKRYSSMRQRSLPETSTPPAVNFSFYPNDYNSTAPPPATQQPLLPNPLAPPTALVAPQVPVTAAPPPLLQAPFPPQAAFATQPPPQAVFTAQPPPQAAFAAQPPPQPTFAAQPPPQAPFTAQPPPQAYLQAPPPPFIAAPASQPQIVSFVTQAQQAFVQGYQGQFNTVTQPTELYQPQGGITYYSTDQQIIQRAVPQKRPKAAIPIVAPTDLRDNRDQREIGNQNEDGSFNTIEVQE